jgi:Lipopolysaccharide export system permease LptF/LptG
MPDPSTRQLLRRHAVAFAVSFVSLTALLVAIFAAKQVPQLSASGVQTGTIAEAVLLAVPFSAAMTIPMAVFLAVLWVFTRLGSEGVLAAAQRRRAAPGRTTTRTPSRAQSTTRSRSRRSTPSLPRPWSWP